MVSPLMRRTGLTLCCGALLVVLLGCGQGTPTAEPSGSTSPSPTASSPAPEPSPTIAVADPEHAVDPPGPRDDRLLSADILVVSEETVPDDVIKDIEGLKGSDGKQMVTGVTSISMAQVPIENRVLDLVAADPGTYRRFTELKSADFQEQWDRVAGGEIALDDQRQKSVKTDENGFITLGSSTDAKQIHVGAWAPQVEGLVDGVVNPKWGEELGMPSGNALLVSTTMVAPDRVQKPIEKIVGESASVQRLDVVARLGIDPGVFQTAVVVGSVSEAIGQYRYTVSGGRVTPESSWVAEHIATEQVPIIGSVTCNKAMLPQLRAALQEVVDSGLADKIHPGEYAGCYYPRFIAGSTTLSNHAFGTALDINVPGNQRGTVGEIDRGVVAIFKKWGFAWGGDWNYTDPMHFEMNRVVSPGSG